MNRLWVRISLTIALVAVTLEEVGSGQFVARRSEARPGAEGSDVRPAEGLAERCSSG